ncbi:MAG: chemotaxis protein CheW, partial [Dehalococcoidia bacterium]|nr:chemotaxis protein CheW [Dehalococcoidia bacterium]
NIASIDSDGDIGILISIVDEEIPATVDPHLSHRCRTGSPPIRCDPRLLRHGGLVDRLLGEQDVVVKSLGDLIGNRKGLTGATILGDGTLGLIIDSASLIAEQAPTAATA